MTGGRVISINRRRQNSDTLANVRTVSARVTQMLVMEFRYYPADTIEAGVRAANGEIARGGSFGTALEAGRNAIVACAGTRNAQRLADFWRRRAAYADKHIGTVEGLLRRSRSFATPEAMARGLERARCVLLGGGTVSAAVVHAYEGVADGK